MRHLSLVLILLLVSASFAGAQDRPVSVPSDSARGQAAAQFQQEHGPEWQIAWHEKAGTPATLMNGRARGYTGPPEQAGRAFLNDHKELFGIENTRQNLDVAKTRQSEKGSSRVQYRQVYRGLPVLNSGYLVAFDQEGAIHYVSGDYYPDLQVDTSPKLQSSDVIETMRTDLEGASSFDVRQEPVLSIFVDDSGEELTAHLAYEARAERRDPLEAYKYVVDAHSGKILQKVSLIQDAHRRTGERTSRPPRATGSDGRLIEKASFMISGTGDVYTTNPLHGSPTSVTLHRLRDVSPRELYGYDVDINDRFGDDATSSSGSFHYSPSDHRFDQVMSYYHSDEFEAWLVGDLGMSSTRLDGEVDVETRSNQCYACMDASNQNAYFSDGSGYTLKNPTRERSIVTHEYMHAVSHQYNTLDQSFNADALNEGYSDFFAVADRHANTSVTSKRLGAYVGLGSGRTVDNDYQLSEFENKKDLTGGGFSEHDGGVVLAGALWDFNQNIGSATPAAEITLESLSYLDNDPSFFDARNAMLTAADNTGNSQHECDIRQAFADHGIGTALYAGVSGPTSLDEGEQGTWTASASCPDGSPSYTWYVDSGGGFYQVGTGSSLTWGKDQISSSITVDVKVVASAGGESDAAQTQVLINNNDGGGGGSRVSTNRICLSTESKASAIGAEALPDTARVGTVAPNPVRSQARLSVALPERVNLEVALYNTVGQEVRRYAVTRSAGWHAMTIGVEGLSSGVYFARVTVGDVTKTRRIVVVR